MEQDCVIWVGTCMCVSVYMGQRDRDRDTAEWETERDTSFNEHLKRF